jgi:hypothetical protein
LENFSKPSIEELRAESLTDQEVHELLERIGARDFGGAENSTIGAVAEATGKDPEAIGRLLADIRKEDFEKRFGLQLGEHESRIETLEERTARLQRLEAGPDAQSTHHQSIDLYAQVALDRLADRERQREALRPVAIVLAIVMLLVFVIMVGKRGPRPGSPDWHRPTVSTQIGDGQLTMDDVGNVWVQKNDGTRRDPTDEEKQRALEMSSAFISK